MYFMIKTYKIYFNNLKKYGSFIVVINIDIFLYNSRVSNSDSKQLTNNQTTKVVFSGFQISVDSIESDSFQQMLKHIIKYIHIQKHLDSDWLKAC